MYSNNSNLSGYKQAIDTLTGIDKRVVEQNFYEVNIPDFVDVEVGNNAWKDQIFTYESFEDAGDGMEGFQVDTSNESRMPAVDVSYDGKIDFRKIWNKKVSYKLIDIKQLQELIRNGEKNFSIIEDKLVARKRNFDQMLQKVAFLGNTNFANINGLVNNPNITVDVSTFTTSLGEMPDDVFRKIISTMTGRFTTQANYVAQPNRLLIPYSVWNSLNQFNSIQFPMKSLLEVLEDTLKKSTMNNDFKILWSPYCEAELNGTGRDIYVLYRKDPDVLVLDIPVEYNTTAFNSPDNYTFYNVGYGQVGGVRIFRPQEVLYFSAPVITNN